MSDLNLIYRDRMVRAVLGTCPAILAKEADIAAVDRLCCGLVDAERAKALLCAKGYGVPSQTLVDLVCALPSVRRS